MQSERQIIGNAVQAKFLDKEQNRQIDTGLMWKNDTFDFLCRYLVVMSAISLC